MFARQLLAQTFSPSCQPSSAPSDTGNGYRNFDPALEKKGVDFIAICSPCLFGLNLECTRRVGYSGLYAQMLLNRKFAAGTQGFYPVEWNGMKGFGQTNEMMFLKRGTAYCLSARGGSHVRMRLVTEYGAEIFACEGGDARYVAQYTFCHVRFEAVSDAPLTCVSLMPADALFGCRRDVLELIRGMHPGFIRFPGGCFAERYHWKDGLLPVDERPAITDGGLPFLLSASYGNDAHELGIDEYISLCRYVGSEPAATVRVSENDAQDAADFVEYCNGDETTPWGLLRAQRRFKKPHNISTWYIGNELANFAQGDPESNARLIAERSDAFVRAMHKADPSIKTVVSTGNNPQWDKCFLLHAREKQIAAHHCYLFDLYPEADMAKTLKAADEVVLPRLWKARKILGDLPLCFDEWNLRWGSMGDAVSALYAANLLRMLIKNGEALKLMGAAYFAPVNEGAIRVYPDHAQYAPDGEVLRRAAMHAGGEILPCTIPDAVCTRHEGFDYYTICNTSMTADAAVDLAGEWDVLRAENETVLTIEHGCGRLRCIPPCSVAYLKRNHKEE